MKNSDILDISCITAEEKVALFAWLSDNNMRYSVGIELYEAQQIVEELEYESSWESSSC